MGCMGQLPNLITRMALHASYLPHPALLVFLVVLCSTNMGSRNEDVP